MTYISWHFCDPEHLSIV